MNNKTLSIISYITLIGWLVAFFSGNEKADSLLKYHLKQALGLGIVSILFNVILSMISIMIPALSFLSMIGLVFVILWIIGIINAANGAKKPIPVIGKMFARQFAFID